MNQPTNQVGQNKKKVTYSY